MTHKLPRRKYCGFATWMLLVHHPYNLSLSLWSNGAPEHDCTDKQPAVTPNDEPSQGYQDSYVH